MAVQLAHLGQQLAHMPRTTAGSRLISRHANPLNQILSKQAAERHQHQADGTVAADKGFNAVVQTGGDNVLVHRVENDDGVVFHAQRRGGVNPVALPAAFTQLRVNIVGVIAALTRDNNVQRLQCFQIECILKRATGTATKRWSRLPQLGGGEKNRANGIKIALFNHALHEDRADHSAPADKTNIFHNVFLRGVCCLFQASFLLVSPSHYKMQLKSQVKLINDCQAISNVTNFA